MADGYGSGERTILPADVAVANNLFEAGSHTSGTIAVNSPPTSGSWQNAQSVQVNLTENQTRYFTKLFQGSGNVPISVTSTATVLTAGPACILGLNNSASGTVTFWGNSTANLTACNVATNSNSATGFLQGNGHVGQGLCRLRMYITTPYKIAVLVLRRETAQEEEIAHQDTTLGIRTTQGGQGIGHNEAFGLVDHGNRLNLDQQVGLKQPLLESRTSRAWATVLVT